MDSADISILPELSIDELWQIMCNWTPSQWEKEANTLTAEQLSAILSFLNSESSDWQDKLSSLLKGLEDKPKLEALGKGLTSLQAASILSHVQSHPFLIDKLPPIFVGMPQEIFCQLLTVISQEELIPLKQEALSETVQHHLTLLIQDLTKQFSQFQADLENKEASFNAMNSLEFTNFEIQTIYAEIDSLQQQGAQFQKLINVALAIAWNTMRSDLIENLSRIKEQHQRLLNAYEGEHNLKANFDSRINQIFNEFDNDEIPATEALAKFGIWYLKDYWEIGLLPDVKSENELQSPANISPGEAQAQREKLFLEVNANLEKIGLTTLSDLKKAQIYSKSALTDYIANHP